MVEIVIGLHAGIVDTGGPVNRCRQEGRWAEWQRKVGR